MPPNPKSPPREFDNYIRELRQTRDVPRDQLEEYMASEILRETRNDGGSLWLSFLDSFLTSIRRVVQETRGGDEILDGVVRRLEAAKVAAGQ